MSELFKLNSRDAIKGATVAVLVAVLSFAQQSIQQKGLAFDGESLVQIGNVAITALIGYLLKNLVSDEDGKIGGKL